MDPKFHLISGSTQRQRIRLPKRVFTALRWESEPRCYGLFRREGDLLVAPVDLESKNSTHPFFSAQSAIKDLDNPSKVSTVSDIPSVEDLAARNRSFEFDTKLAGEQLDLKVGHSTTFFLGWRPDQTPPPPIFAAIWGHVLVLASEKRMTEALEGPELDYDL